MGLVRATVGAIGGTLADQWKDFLTVPPSIQQTAALFPAIPVGTNADRGSDTQGSRAIVTNGSKIVVPEGYGLLLFQEGELTAYVDEPGGYVWSGEDVNSQSVFAGDKSSTSLVLQSWERFKFGGRPGAQQLALFVRTKELPNNRFGTQSEIYWDDAYLGSQVGALAHGTYSLKIVDPIVFAKEFVPASYLQALEIFDFTDRSNVAAHQLFSEVVGCLAAAFSSYTNDAGRGNRITSIQRDSIGFAKSLSDAVEETYDWRAARGLSISKVTIVGIDYDEPTKELLKTVQRADALAGTRGNSNLQASVAEGMQSAGAEGGAGGILGLGIAAGSLNLPSLMQQASPNEPETATEPGEDDLVATLRGLQRALDADLINQAEFDAARANALGIS